LATLVAQGFWFDLVVEEALRPGFRNKVWHYKDADCAVVVTRHREYEKLAQSSRQQVASGATSASKRVGGQMWMYRHR